MAALTPTYVATTAGPIHVRIGGVRQTGTSPIVLLHHTPSSSASMVALADALAPRRVIAPDLPGFGDSPPLAGEPDVDRWADAIAAALSRLEVTRATVFGHHAGAVVAAALAAREPARVARLILSAPPPVDADARAVLAAQLRVPSPPVADGSHVAAAWSRIAAKAPGLAVAIHHRETVLALAAGAGYARAFEAILAHDLGATLARVRCPCWVTAAPDDPLARYAPDVAAQIAATWIPLPAGGVYVCDQHPTTVAQLVRTTEDS